MTLVWPPDYQPPSGPPPLTNLAEFLEAVRNLLDKITGIWSELLIVHDRRKPMREAYEDLQQRDVFLIAKDKLEDPDPTLSSALSDAGLTGKQLEMKLGKGRSLWQRFWQSAGPKWLTRLLGWINKMLKSLTAALPGVEAIHELKEACEEEMKDAVPEA